MGLVPAQFTLPIKMTIAHGCPYGSEATPNGMGK